MASDFTDLNIDALTHLEHHMWTNKAFTENIYRLPIYTKRPSNTLGALLKCVTDLLSKSLGNPIAAF